MNRIQKLIPAKSKHIIWVVFALLLLTTSLFVYQAWLKNRDLRRHDLQVRQTLIIMRGYADIRSALAESELIVKKDFSRDVSLQQDLQYIHQHLNELLQATASRLIDSLQKKNFKTLSSSVSELEQMQLSFLGDSTASLASAARLRLYRHIERILNRLDERQNHLLELRDQASDNAATRSFNNTLQGAALIFAFVILLLFRLNRDISRRQQAENIAIESEKKYRLLIEGAAATIFTTNLGGRFNYVSAKCQQLTGYSPSELQGQPYTMLVAPDWLSGISELYQQQFEKQIPETTQEFEIVDRTGNRKWVEQHATLLLKDEKPIGLQCIVKDISEKKEAEAKLQESQRITQSLLDHTREGFIMIDRSYHILLLNRQARIGMELLVGHQVETGMSIFDVMMEKDKPAAEASFAKVFAGEQVETESAYDSPSGQQWIRISHSPVRDEAGEITGAAIVIHDITASRNQALQLRDADQKIRAMLSSTRDGFYMIDHDYRVLMINEAGRELVQRATGKQISEGMKIIEFLGPSRIRSYRDLIENAKAGRRQEIENKVEMPEGEYWFHNTYFPVKNEKGEVIAVCATTQDITERKLIDKAIERVRLEKEEYQFRLQSILDNTPVMVFIKDTEGRYLLINKAFREMYAVSDRDIIGKTDFDFEKPEAARRYREADELVIFTQENLVSEEKLLRSDGEYSLLIVKFPLFDRQGKVYGVGCIATDISERVRQRQQLIEARQKAENAERLQEQFLANMSHEIRTPMNGIIGMADILAETALNPQQQEFLDIIRHSSANLMGLINDILDLSKIKAGKLTVEHTVFDLCSMMHHTLAPFQLPASNKNLQLIYEPDPQLPEQVISDPLRLTQVLTNLIGNALKFTETGSITVSVKLVSIEKNSCTLQFVVADTGIGIAAERLPYIFDSFEQAEAGTARKYGGTGLGLSISRNLVQMLGGELEVQSQVGQGTCFSFQLPLSLPQSVERLASTSSAATAPKELAGKKILVAEDNEINQKVIFHVLQKAGMQVSIANNGQEATEILETNKDFDAIILDLRMPLMDGFQTAVYIREKLKCKMPIIAMTASALRNEKERCMQMGMNGYMTKPFSPPKLFEMLQQLLQKPTDTVVDGEAREQEATAAGYNLSYLHEMDDAAYSQEILSLFLESTPIALGSMSKAAMHEEWDALYAEAHKLKSATGLLQMQQLTDLLIEVEQQAKGRKDMNELETTLKKLKEQYELLQPMIQAELKVLAKEPGKLEKAG
jgi:PAS domain S-box-containing protein